jgi:hypothetical protein
MGFSMFSRHTRLAAAFVMALAAAGCSSTKPPVQKLPEISFADKKPIALDVGRLEIVSEYTSPLHSPNVEHLMPVSPEAAAQRWAQDRLKPMGRTGTARVVIKDAHVFEKGLKTDKGFTGLFKTEQEYRYDAALAVAVEILDERGFPTADTMATATRSRTAPEGITINERDRILYDISETMIRDIDSQMDTLMRSYLGRWIIR